jgi:hypothetical protein
MNIAVKPFLAPEDTEQRPRTLPEAREVSGDIVGGDASDYLVTGFFTPNYRSLAEAHAAGLRANGVPHHLYAVDAGDWLQVTLLKPSIVGRAMADYPGKRVWLMDVDCSVHGPLEQSSRFTGDISLYIGVKYYPTGWRGMSMSVRPSTRSIIFSPTEPTGHLLKEWQSLCERQLGAKRPIDDEALLMRAISTAEGLSTTMMNQNYSGRDYHSIGGEAIVQHDSANEKLKPIRAIKRSVQRAKRRMLSKLLGKDYREWKYGGL